MSKKDQKEQENTEAEKQDDTVSEEVAVEEAASTEEEQENPNAEESIQVEEVAPVEDISKEELKEIEKDAKKGKTEIPEFRAGDTVRVLYKIIEGDKTRIQPYEGIVIAKKGGGVSKTFTVRRIGADGVGVERIFPLHSPNITKLEVKRKGKVRRAKLYYLRDKKGRAAIRVKERKAKKKSA